MDLKTKHEWHHHIAIMRVWHMREYRAFAFSLLFAGIAISSSIPLVTLFLTRELHVAASIAGLFFLTALVGPPTSVYLGHVSDRLSTRLPLIQGSAVWLAMGWVIIAISHQIWLVIAVGILFFCVTGTLSAQIFAALRDVLAQEGEKREGAVTSTIRTAYSLGWIIGPIIGGWLAGVLSVRAAFAATACLYLVAALPLWHLGVEVPRRAATESPAPHMITRANGPLLIFALVCLLVLSGDAIKLAYLPVYLVGGLKQSIVTFGSLLSVAAIVELAVMPTAGILADWVGMRPVIIGGIAIGALDYAILAGSTALWQLYLVQVLHVAVIAALLGVGITYAQRLGHDQTGLASSVFFGAQGLASPLGGLVGSYGVHLFGIPHVFGIPSFFCALSVVVLLAMRKNERART